ncbi:MAG: tRNA (N6-isopentenyl adenosine(37)-C2)-methylthiotransferase MiaB [candidate division WOR-3 bacterium]
MRRNFYITTYGCQMNQYDAGIVKEILKSAGYSPVADENEADIILLLTCSVRKHAENRALGRLMSMKRKKDGQRIFGVLGCMAQNYKEELISHYGADLVVGPDGYQHLPSLLANLLTTQPKMPQVWVGLNQECYDGIYPKAESSSLVTGFVAIMRGCNNFCSYCIVPYVRGQERSKSPEQITREIEILTQSGVKTITLVGQNVLAYHYNGMDFGGLLKEVEKIPGVEWLRFITAHPKDFSKEVITTLAGIKKFCPCIHLPLQSGSNRILALMNRRYTKEEYLERIELARQYIPEVVFTTDIMVGFPTETEDDFNQTKEMLEKIRFDFAYMFQYSPRPQTQALTIKPEVDFATGRRRLAKLIALQSQITKENNQKLIGQELEVMVEKHQTDQSLARTKSNKVVVLDRLEPIGAILKVKIIGMRGWTLVGAKEP